MWFWRQGAEERKRTRQMNALVSAHVQAGAFAGVVRVTRGDQVIYERAAGLASIELGAPNTMAQTFRIGSVSKPFTTLAILQLVEQGRISLDDPLARFVEKHPQGERILVRHLLSNSTGIPDYLLLEGGGAWYAQPAAPVELIARFASLPLLFAPGSRLGYSNSNWVLLAAILEAVSGERYGDYLRKHLLAPLGLAQTGHEESGELVPQRAAGYSLRDGAPAPATPIDPSVCIGGGSLYATAADLGRLDRALAHAALWQPQTLAAAWTPRHQAEDGSAYGFGFQLGERWGRRWNGHSGGTFGYTAFFTRYVDDDALIVVLSNYENGSASRLEQNLAAILFDQPYTLPAERTFVHLPPDQLARCTGRYLSTFMGRTIPFDVILEGDKLYARFALLPRAHLRPLTDTRFFTHLKGGEVEFTFAGPAALPASHVEINWAGVLSNAPRIEEQMAA